MSDSINPADYGVLTTGFARMRLPEIRQAIINSLQAKTQLTFETRPDSITGQFIDVFAEREATIWELAQAVYHSMYPISAFGVNLDHAVSFAGVTRLFAKQSSAFVTLYGTQDTVISAGAIMRTSASRDDFVLQEDVTIDSNAIGDITFSVDTAEDGDTYSITLTKSGEATIIASYEAQIGDTNVDIAGHLAPALVTSNYTVEQDAATIRVYRIDGLNFQTNHSAGISVTKLGVTGFALASNYGALEIPVNSITQIISTQIGWDSVTNITPGQPGRSTETDDQLRQRYNRGVYRLGAGTIDSIQANLEQNILGLVSVFVYENTTNITDGDGRPAHSIEVVIQGGDPSTIANEIFRVKPAGINTFGSVSVDVTDSESYVHTINFNRPSPVYVWVKVEINKYTEEVFPGSGDLQIAQIIMDTGNTFGVGKDVIHQRFIGPIFAKLNGISSVVITTALTTDPDTVPAPGDYTSSNKAIAIRELSRFALERITVEVNA